jgi:S-layer protein (TIGR01564 family)
VKLDAEIEEKDSEYNWILIGGLHVNTWVETLVDLNIVPDDGSPVSWFLTETGYKLYTDPFRYGNKVLVVAGKTAENTQKAIRMLVEDITS